mgnify:CR=1 FL=1
MKLLNEILGTKYPIIQGGMANIATGEFAAACSNAGALGIIGAGGMNADTLRENIRRCKQLTDKPFGVNIMLMHPQADEFAQIVVEEGVQVVTTGAGNPGKYVPMWKAAGIKVIPVVAAAVLAKHLEPLGIDAVIASDFAAILHARRIGVEVHISTQSNISNSEAVKFFSQWADTVVLARELTLEQVARIHREIAENDIRGPRGELVQLEMFAHGALCMSVSGKCYLSLYETNCSANRGACRQLCRRKYTVTDKETGAQLDIDGRYVLSPKDLCTIDFLDKMIAAGVRVLKIEGRARGAEYVKRVVECYDQALKAMESGTYTPALTAELKERLRTVFNRGFWEGYYAGRPVVEHSPAYGSSATQRKVYVGKVTNFYRKLSVAEVSVEAAPLAVGEPIFFLGATTGVAEQTLTELHGPDGQPAESVAQGELCAIRTPGVVRRGDQLYKFVPAETT